MTTSVSCNEKGRATRERPRPWPEPYGGSDTMTIPRDPYDRWIEKVDKDGPLPTWAPFLGPCWLWTAAIDSRGYGGLALGGRGGNRHHAHRVGYELLVGPIPDDLQIDHLCRVRHCVNPAHLEPVTLKDNVLRGVGLTAVNARKTHCLHGHEFTPENTYRPPKHPEKRFCRACRAEVDARRQVRLRSAR